MTEDLKKLILKAGEVLQSYGATEVFFFGSATKMIRSDRTPLDFAVSGLPPDKFYEAMGTVLSVIKKRCNLVDLDENTPYARYLKSHGKQQPDLFTKIRNDLGQLRELLDTFSPIISRVRMSTPTNVEIIALAGVIQFFYNGLDKIFRRIIAEYDLGFTHKISDIGALEQVSMATPGRAAVLSKMVMEQLRPYLSFRQVFSNSYSHDLNWLKIRDLVGEAEEIFLLVESELIYFIEGDR